MMNQKRGLIELILQTLKYAIKFKSNANAMLQFQTYHSKQYNLNEIFSKIYQNTLLVCTRLGELDKNYVSHFDFHIK